MKRIVEFYRKNQGLILIIVFVVGMLLYAFLVDFYHPEFKTLFGGG